MRSVHGSALLVFIVLLCAYGHVNEVFNSNLDSDVFDTKEHSLELTQFLNLARQELIHETCSRFPPKLSLDDLPPSSLEHILIDDTHRFLYCYVPKVACTNWKRILMILDGKWNSTDVLSIPANLAHNQEQFRNLSSVPKHERDWMLENYNKLIIARNPFERLLSAFRNKLEGDGQSARYFQEHVGRHIIKAFRANPSNHSLEYGQDVTFEEFALFLTNKSKNLMDIVNNEHWQPISSLCYPCLIKYNLVGKYETLVDDSTLALHTIGASYIGFPRLARTSGTAEKLLKYFSTLPLHLVKRLYKLYKVDYRMFNYNLDNIIGFDLG